MRPSWDEYFMSVVDAISMRGTCDRGRPGAVLVRDNQILATGYAGSPAGLPHCHEVGHLIHKVVYEDGTVREHCRRTTHAEMNAIIQAARNGVSTLDSTLYTTMEPCMDCAKALINAGIKKVVARNRYHGAELTREWFEKLGIQLVVLEDRELY